jgi:hypothetical protein
MRNPLLAVLLLCASSSAMAKDVDLSGCSGCQDSFDAIAEDLVATIDYKAAGPSEATGLTGFGIGLVTTLVPVDEDDWNAVTGSDFSEIGLAGVQVTKGLPFDIDLGAFYATAPGSNVDVFGGEVRYALLAGSTVSPAVALRLSYVTASGIDDFDLDSTAFDVSVSKGFGPITPFGGIGYVKGSADPDPSFGLKEAKVDEAKYFAGVRLSLGFFEITPQFSSIAGVTAWTARLGFSFGL